MKKNIKLSVNFIIYFTSLILTSFVNNPFNCESSMFIAKKHGGHGGGHRRHHRGHHRRKDGFRFRFDVSPAPRYYYYYPEYRYVTLFCEIYYDEDTRVSEVQIGDRVIFSPANRSNYSFSLRPGYHTIRWRVENNKYFGQKYRNYSKTIKVHRNLEQIYVRIKGSDISIRSY